MHQWSDPRYGGPDKWLARTIGMSKDPLFFEFINEFGSSFHELVQYSYDPQTTQAVAGGKCDYYKRIKQFIWKASSASRSMPR